MHPLDFVPAGFRPRTSSRPQAQGKDSTPPHRPGLPPLPVTPASLMPREVAEALRSYVMPGGRTPRHTGTPIRFGADPAPVSQDGPHASGSSTPAGDQEPRTDAERPTSTPLDQKLDQLLASDGHLQAAIGPTQQVRADAATLQRVFKEFHRDMDHLLMQMPPHVAAPIRLQMERLNGLEDLAGDHPPLLASLDEALAALQVADSSAPHGNTAEELPTPSLMQRWGKRSKQVASNAWTQALLLSAVATCAKTAAWYAHTVIPNSAISSPTTPPLVTEQRKVGISWGVALLEYPFVILGSRVAEKAGISLTKLRSPIELMDLGCFVAFLKGIKREDTDWRHYSGIAVSALGCAVMNMPEGWGTAATRGAKRPFQRIAQALRPGTTRDLERNALATTQPSARSLVQQTQAMERLIEQMDGPVKSEIEKLQFGLQQVANGNFVMELNPPSVHMASSLRATAAAGALERLQPALASMQAVAQTASELSQALQQGHGEMRDLVAGTTHLSRNAQKYLFLCMAAVIHTGCLVGAFSIDSPRAKAALFSVIAAGIKTLAWYGHTAIPDNKMLSSRISPDRPRLRGLAQAAENIGLGWGIAHLEYQPLVKANSLASEHGDSLSAVRGAIVAADLLWMAAFMKLVKGEKLGLQHGMGLALAGLGVALANLPASR